jgi:BNR/Asp-box repeat
VITYFGVGPKPQTFPRRQANDGHSSSGRITALALGADGRRMYAGSFAGVWRSDDGGESWAQLTYPQPPIGVTSVDIPGALYAPHVFDVAASPADPDLVLVSVLDSQFSDGRDGVYRSADGGRTWTLVLKSTSAPTSTPFNVVFAPDNPRLVYAAGTVTRTVGPSQGFVAISRDAGATWTTRPVGSPLWHIAVAPLEPDGTRRVYAAGDGVIWYSKDGGQTWTPDAGVVTINATRQFLKAFQHGCDPNAGVGGYGGATAYAGGDAPQILAVEPGNPDRVYLATTGGALGPTYYSDKVPDGTPVNSRCERLAGEASLWLGDYGQFEASGSANWRLLPGPPVYTGFTSPSGNCYVATKSTSAGFHVFFSDNSHVHVSVGTPTDNSSWHRLDGMDASMSKRTGQNFNVLFMHADPHAIAFTPDFEITLKEPTGIPAAYKKNSELDQHVAGSLWLANDGGVYWCDDGGRKEESWQMPSGLETIDPVNVAGLFGLGDAPALYFGCGDNNDFFTRDGGAHWEDPGSGCGDCDAWFTDTAQAGRVLQFLPRKKDASGFVGVFGIVKSDGSEYPNAGDSGSKTLVPSPKKINFNKGSELSPYAGSDVYLIGYRPLIRTLATEAPLPDGDVAVIEQALDGTANLFRTTAISSIKKVEDWHDTSKAQQIGPTLPPGAIVVQASGGHASPAYYVADRPRSSNGFTQRVWKLSSDGTAWTMIVPGAALGSAPVGSAFSWFVDPYDPDVIYVLDAQGMKISTDAGASWFFDTAMTNALTGGGKLAISASLLQDMQFSRGERQTRFAMGTAGVLCTMDFGIYWFQVLNSVALPGRPESAFFDPISDQTDRAIYVDCEGRSILRVSGLPELPPFQPPEPIGLMELAALDY